MTAGRLLYPSTGVVQDRNTYDTILNGGINPILHLGSDRDGSVDPGQHCPVGGRRALAEGSVDSELAHDAVEVAHGEQRVHWRTADGILQLADDRLGKARHAHLVSLLFRSRCGRIGLPGLYFLRSRVKATI